VVMRSFRCDRGSFAPSDAQRLSGRAALAMGRACHVAVVPATPRPARPG
jgi:hypothetical protein